MIRNIETNKIVSGTNIREENDNEIMELADSIRRRGLLNPITVRKKGDKYRVIAGHRRFLAMQVLHEPWIECNVLEYEPTEKEILCIQLQENCCRKDMSAWEYVDIFEKLKAQGMTNKEIAFMCGRSEAWVTNQFQAAYTLEKNNAVTEQTKKMSCAAVRKEFHGFAVRTTKGRKERGVTFHVNEATLTYTVTVSNEKARPEFEKFMKEFVKKWQN